MRSSTGRLAAPLVVLVVALGALSIIGHSSLVRVQARDPAPLTITTVVTTVILEGGVGSPAPFPALPPDISSEPSPEGRGLSIEPGEAASQGHSSPVHVVAPGETIDGIAALVGIAPADLAAYNGLTVDEALTAGMVLALPAAAGGGR